MCDVWVMCMIVMEDNHDVKYGCVAVVASDHVYSAGGGWY